MPQVLVVGSGGREHALALALFQSPSQPKVFVAPGNPGSWAFASPLPLGQDWVDFAIAKALDLVVIGPEAPLVAGMADKLREAKIPVLGPSQAAARLEGSKTFAKGIMDAAKVPTARWEAFTEAEPAIAFARSLGGASVIKADGLAAGKGVVVASDLAEAEAAILAILGGKHGKAGHRIVVEERLIGEELSVIALSDGDALCLMAPSQDHKRLKDGDLGPNTGGMGAYAPAPRGDAALLTEVEQSCLRPIILELARQNAPFSGVLYAGLMLTAEGPKVLEYNVRFGDPETQAILPLVDSDLYWLFLATAEGRLAGQRLALKPLHAATVVLASPGYPEAPKTGDVIAGLAEAEAVEGATVYHAGTRLNEAGQVVTAGGRVLSVTGLGESLEAALQKAYEASSKIHWPGVQFRRDIGFRGLSSV